MLLYVSSTMEWEVLSWLLKYAPELSKTHVAKSNLTFLSHHAQSYYKKYILSNESYPLGKGPILHETL